MSGNIHLHLGCGTKKLKGWVNIDSVESVNPDLLHDITKPLPFEELSVDEILAEDLLEHFDKYMRFVVVYEWVRLLKIGGKLNVQVPDFKKILFKYFKFGFDNFVDFIFGENLWQSEFYLGYFGNHKWGYSKKSLVEFFQLFGLELVSLKNEGLNIRFIGKKIKHLTFDDIKNIKIHSHANKFGNGKAVISVEDAFEKIKKYQQDLSSSDF